MNSKINFPALFILNNTSDIVVRKKNEMIADQRFLNDEKHKQKYDKNVTIIDSTGKMFFQTGVRSIGGVNLWLSIWHVGKILKIEPILEEKEESIKLDDLKVLVMNIVRKKPQKWLPIGPVGVIQELIDEALTYKEVMQIFNTKI